MDNNQKMNILVLGVSGAGKSTLIKAVSGTEVVTGVGQGQTQEIEVFESDTWPFRLIDTKGFEYNIVEQLKTIHQVKKYTKEQVKDDDEDTGIDAVWYCIDGCARRPFSHTVQLINKSIKGWKNIPIFAVITKSYSDIDVQSNIDAVQQSFAKAKSANLKKIIPVIAEEFQINTEITVAPKGVDELCAATLDCFDEAKEISKENQDRMILEQRRYTANALVAGTSTAGAAVGAFNPFELTDAALLVPLETGMTKGVLKIYGVEVSGDIIVAIVGTTAITNIAKTIVKAITGKIPGAGQIINGTVAGVIVEALGQAVIAASEAMYTGKLDPTKIDEIVAFINSKLKDSAVIGAAISYLEENADKLDGKSPKAILGEIQKTVAKKKD